MKNVVWFILLILLSGCITERRCNEKYPLIYSTQLRDSVVIIEQIEFKDTLIKTYVEIPKVTIRDSVILIYKNGEALTVKPLFLKGNYSTAQSWLNSGKLFGRLDEGGAIELSAKIKIQEKTITELQKQVSEKTQIKPVKYVPKLTKFTSIVGITFLSLLLIYLIIKIVAKFKFL